MGVPEILSPRRFAEIAAAHAPFFSSPDDLDVYLITGEEASAEGFVNQVARVSDSSGRSAIVKQVLPQMRRLPDVTGELVLPTNRCELEVSAFSIFNTLTPGSTPQIYGLDLETSSIVMQDLAEMNLARFEFARLHEFGDLGLHLGRFLGRNAFYTSNYFLTDNEKIALSQRWTKPSFHDVYVRIFFDWVFGLSSLGDDSELTAGTVEAFTSDPFIRSEAIKLRHKYVNTSESLLHSDFHTSNIFVKPGVFTVIDGEATFWGPSGYDLGTLIGNLMISCMSLQVRPEVSLDDKIAYENYLIDTVEKLVNSFTDEFRDGWNRSARPQFKGNLEYLDFRLTEIFREALGYACLIAPGMAAGFGMSFEYRQIEDPRVRALAQRLTFFTSRQLMELRHEFTTIDEVSALFRRIKSGFKLAFDYLLSLD